jgi:hypothetical protein
MADLVAAPFEVVDAFSSARHVVSSRETPLGEQAFVDPLGKVSKSKALRSGFAFFVIVFLPVLDVITDVVSVSELFSDSVGGWQSRCGSKRLGVYWEFVLAILIWALACGLFSQILFFVLLWRRWPSGVGISALAKLRLAVDGMEEDQSTAGLCTGTGKWRAIHAAQLLVLFLEDLPSCVGSLFLIASSGAPVATWISFFVSVFSLAKGVSLYASLLVVACCRKKQKSDRCKAQSRFLCCACFLVAIVLSFVGLPLGLIPSSQRPALLTVRELNLAFSWPNGTAFNRTCTWSDDFNVFGGDFFVGTVALMDLDTNSCWFEGDVSGELPSTVRNALSVPFNFFYDPRRDGQNAYYFGVANAAPVALLRQSCKATLVALLWDKSAGLEAPLERCVYAPDTSNSCVARSADGQPTEDVSSVRAVPCVLPPDPACPPLPPADCPLASATTTTAVKSTPLPTMVELGMSPTPDPANSLIALGNLTIAVVQLKFGPWQVGCIA